ncbi:MAG: rRNA maturation RNase YbeY [Planctomycetia bacterium]|nr:rRNA maturation RNase YbeY [Planctomycetia bacterium]
MKAPRPAVRVFSARPVPAALRRAAAAAARAAGPLRGPVDVHLVSDREIRRVNRERLGHDWATDVCTFPMGERFLWGELVVSLDTARREARARRLPLARELALYVVHGVLHLRGLDDRSPAQRAAMRRAEAAALASLAKKKGPSPRR